MGAIPASALASRTEATFCFRMRMQAVTGLALSILDQPSMHSKVLGIPTCGVITGTNTIARMPRYVTWSVQQKCPNYVTLRQRYHDKNIETKSLKKTRKCIKLKLIGLVLLK